MSEAPDINLESVPILYRNLVRFCKCSAVHLHPHRPYDLAIDLLRDSVLPRGRLYSLTAGEQRAMDEYVAKGLRNGTLRPSTCSRGFLFLFFLLTNPSLC